MSSEQDTDYHTKIFNDFSRYAPTLRGGRILVVGCGTGRDCKHFVEAGAKHTRGLDIDSNIGRDFQHHSVKYFSGSAEAMPFEDGSYDFVYSVATMEHIHHIDQAFSEMIRVTCEGGLIYSFAAPLWNSREGHHMPELFGFYPWMHLSLSQEEILRHCRQNNIVNPDHDVSHDVEFMFSDYFNFLPAQRYVDVCSTLPVSEVLQNTLWQESEDFLTEPVFRDLQKRGYSKAELLSVSHTFVGRK